MIIKTLSFRIEEEEDKELESIASKLKTDKSTAARRALAIGIKEIKREEAFEKLRKRKWTIWKAAEYCGESYRSFLQLLRDQNIPFPISINEVKREIKSKAALNYLRELNNIMYLSSDVFVFVEDELKKLGA